jgi:multidrug efflux pump
MPPRAWATALTIDNALYDAFGQRIISTIYTQSSQNRVILRQRPDAVRSAALAQLYIPLLGHAGAAGHHRHHPRGRPRWCWRARPVPSATIGFDLAPGVSLGHAVSRSSRPSRTSACRRRSPDFSGAAGAFQSALSNELVLVLAAIVVVYIVLGVLYESFIHPVTILSTLPSAGIGALIALLLTGYGLGVIGIIGIVLLIGIVKKNAIMMIDFAVEAMREEGLTRRSDPPGRASALPPDHDDHLCRAVCRDPLIFGSGMGMSCASRWAWPSRAG